MSPNLQYEWLPMTVVAGLIGLWVREVRRQRRQPKKPKAETSTMLPGLLVMGLIVYVIARLLARL
jgi:hypothetical protein